jgi:hypothetical protein
MQRQSAYEAAEIGGDRAIDFTIVVDGSPLYRAGFRNLHGDAEDG